MFANNPTSFDILDEVASRLASGSPTWNDVLTLQLCNAESVQYLEARIAYFKRSGIVETPDSDIEENEKIEVDSDMEVVYACDKCDNYFTTENLLNFHKMSHHKDDNVCSAASPNDSPNVVETGNAMIGTERV